MTSIAPTVNRTRRAVRVGSVSYLNAKPLIWGLDEADDLDLHLDVPARLLAGLQERRLDVALLPVIDYQRLEGLRVIPAGGIGCNGPTLTVRIFSRTPVDQIHTLACDPESHTSVALARILLARHWGQRPRLVDLRGYQDNVDAKLLIGDKVVCAEPRGFDHQVDLGEAWKQMTGLPFVFAVWTARGGVDLGDLPARLEQARQDGMAHLDPIIARHAIPRGWPAGIAREYLSRYLQFTIGPDQLSAIRLFHQLAHEAGILDHPPRPLVF